MQPMPASALKPSSKHDTGFAICNCFRIGLMSLNLHKFFTAYPLLTANPNVGVAITGKVITGSNVTLTCEFPVLVNQSEVNYEVRWYLGPQLLEVYRLAAEYCMAHSMFREHD